MSHIIVKGPLHFIYRIAGNFRKKVKYIGMPNISLVNEATHTTVNYPSLTTHHYHFTGHINNKAQLPTYTDTLKYISMVYQ